MPSFDTPNPILADLEPVVGNVRIVATDRTDTVVEVRPSNEAEPADVKAAQQTTVEFSGGTLTLRAPKARPHLTYKSRSIDVLVELPSGSRLQGSTGMGHLHATGRLGEASYKSGMGHLQLEQAADLRLRTATGNVDVGRVDGNAEITTSSGRVELGAVTGTADVKNSNGATVVDTVGGTLRVRAANGDITVQHAEDDVDAKTANGAVRVLDAARGELTLESAMGDVQVGIRQGSAAWLDVRTKFGTVRNELADATAPAEGTDKLAVRAHTSFGDITVHRS